MLTSLADGQLLAEKSGNSPPRVVALHGWQRNGTDFATILEGLDAVAINLPGFGVTPEPPSVWGSEDYANLVAIALAELGPVIIVGHSFGGRVAVRLAARYPQLVKGIVLTGVPLVRLVPAPKASLGFRIVRSLARSGLVSQKALDRQRDKHGSPDYRAASGVMRGVLVRVISENYRDDLALVEAPVRMVWGENDTQAPADAGLAASKLIAKATFREVPGAEHLLEGDLAAAVREELLGLLGERGSVQRGSGQRGSGPKPGKVPQPGKAPR
jgi:pimeloyl-ACP methyl ester carboxylesterase